MTEQTPDLRERIADVLSGALPVGARQNMLPVDYTHAADVVMAVVSLEVEQTREECGGCRGIGSHRRWCPAKVGHRNSLLGRLSEQAEDLGDRIGANCPEAANSAYRAAGLLRDALSRPEMEELHRAGEETGDY